MMGDALRSAGASEEILAVMQSCFDACIKPTGRPRKHANRTERERAYRARRKELAKRHAANDNVGITVAALTGVLNALAKAATGAQ